jgi:hypothetical protein
MSKKGRRTAIPPERMLDFVQTFNRLVTLDEELARQLPGHEFELSFDDTGNIYVDGKPLGVNVKQRHRALRLRGTRRS